MKIKFRFTLFLLTFILIFTALGNISYAINLPNRVVYFSEKGQHVKEVQIALNAIGYNLTVDGSYGPGTKASISDFQRKHSGLSVDGSYGPSTRLYLLKALENKQTPNKDKIVYLTFDDGPSKTITPEILRILKDYNIEATFFVLGSMAEKSPELIREIKDKGHAIGNHSYSHKYDIIYKNMDNFLQEIKSTEKVLKDILGQDFYTKLLRFPGGSSGDVKIPYIEAAKARGYDVYDWNALNGDSEAIDVAKDKLIERLILTESKVKKGELIVLMHDTYGKETTVEALPAIIEYLRDKGYTFRKLIE